MPNVSSFEVLELSGGGIGSISRQARFDSHPDNEQLANEAQEAIVAGDYLATSPNYECNRCGDGRRPELYNFGTQVFGATPGIVKSAILAGYVEPGASLPETIKTEVKIRDDFKLHCGAHRADTHGKEGACGCGECDGAQAAFANYLKNEEALKPLVTGLWSLLGIEERHGVFSEDAYDAVVSRVTELVEVDYFVDGPAQVGAIGEEFGEDFVEDLIGDHKEVLWVINLVEGTKFSQVNFINRFDSFDEDGKGIQSFWEDQWAIEKELGNYSRRSGDAMIKLLTADLVRRVATAANLTAADLNLVVLK